jgi:hypothetical protein
MLAPITPIKTSVFAIFSCTNASSTVPSSQATLEASTCIVSLKDEGVRGSGQNTNQQKSKAPNVRFLLKDR